MSLARKPNFIVSADITLPPNVNPEFAVEDLHALLELFFMGGPLTRWIRTKRGTHVKRVVSIRTWVDHD
jgi:hypothetical protein